MAVAPVARLQPPAAGAAPGGGVPRLTIPAEKPAGPAGASAVRPALPTAFDTSVLPPLSQTSPLPSQASPAAASPAVPVREIFFHGAAATEYYRLLRLARRRICGAATNADEFEVLAEEYEAYALTFTQAIKDAAAAMAGAPAPPEPIFIMTLAEAPPQGHANTGRRKRARDQDADVKEGEVCDGYVRVRDLFSVSRLLANVL
jgi:hypothetical protein